MDASSTCPADIFRIPWSHHGSDLRPPIRLVYPSNSSPSSPGKKMGSSMGAGAFGWSSPTRLVRRRERLRYHCEYSPI